jgi:hypothetical protein
VNNQEIDTNMQITKHLKTIKYDYLPLCHSDGIRDDSQIIQMRIDAGLDPLKSLSAKGRFLICKTIKITSAVLFDGSQLITKGGAE